MILFIYGFGRALIIRLLISDIRREAIQELTRNAERGRQRYNDMGVLAW